MAKIRILPENLVNQIAAGEVVERAASVLKELVENALDAGATRIQIHCKGHGRDLIQVVDDGCGMARDDMQLAFERHATSKLAHADDLYAIRTMGFRGEALPSIASVSSIEIRSSAEGQASGTALRIEAGEILHEEPIAAPRGTSIAVHSLFFNTPARAKFLKSRATELSHMVKIFKQYAIARPDISWYFSHENSVEYTLPASSLHVRLEDLFGSGFNEKTLPLDFNQAGITIAGAVGKPELNRKSRGDQFIFLNRRPIQSALLHSAFKAALREHLEPNEWPFYVVFVEMNPREFDVNVHPSKLEVKFVDEKLVHATLYRAIRLAIPSLVTAERPGEMGLPALGPLSAHPADRLGGSVVPEEIRQAWLPSSRFTYSTQSIEQGVTVEGESSGEREVTRSEPLLRPAIYQMHNKYLISSVKSGIAIIDQHAAHERILYERALKGFEERAFHSQQLLFPLLLELDVEEDALFQEVRESLGSLGFVIRDFGPRTYSVEAVPAGLKRASETDMIHAMLEEYVEFRHANFEPRKALAASFACKAALRTGDTLTAEEMTSLVDELFATEFPTTCPHGRPTIIHLKLTELDRRFKRTE